MLIIALVDWSVSDEEAPDRPRKASACSGNQQLHLKQPKIIKMELISRSTPFALTEM